MDFSTLAVLVFGGILLALWYGNDIQFFQVLVATLFGFYLADSDIAPTIGTAVESVFEWVGSWQL